MSKKITDNPYIQSRLLWNDLTGGIQTKLENSYRLLFICCSCLIITISGLVYMASQSLIKPYVVMLRGDELVTINELKADEFKSLESKLAIHLIHKFILRSRTLSSDEQINEQNRVASFSVTSGIAATVLRDHFKKIQEKNQLVFIEVQSILVKSAGVIDIRWIETKRHQMTGETLKRNHYSAEISYQFNQPSLDPIVSKHNPLGFYITELAWAKDLVEE